MCQLHLVIFVTINKITLRSDVKHNITVHERQWPIGLKRCASKHTHHFAAHLIGIIRLVHTLLVNVCNLKIQNKCFFFWSVNDIAVFEIYSRVFIIAGQVLAAGHGKMKVGWINCMINANSKGRLLAIEKGHAMRTVFGNRRMNPHTVRVRLVDRAAPARKQLRIHSSTKKEYNCFIPLFSKIKS